MKRDMKYVKKALQSFLLVLFIFFLLMIIAIATYHYFDNNQLINTKKTEAKVVHKVAKKGYLLPPTYFVIVDEKDNASSSIYDATRHYVSKKEMNQLEVDDMIVGFTTDGHNFSTVLDFLLWSFWYFAILLAVVPLTILFTYPYIPEIKFIKRFLQWFTKKLSTYTVDHKQFKPFMIAMIILICSCFSFLFLLNIFHETVSPNQSKTEAKIIEKNMNRSSGRYSRTHYYLTLEYHTDQGKQLIIKSVSSQTYKLNEGTNVNISYRNSNSYDVYISKANWKKAIKIIISVETFIFSIMIFTFYALMKPRDNIDKKRVSHKKNAKL